MMYIVVLEALTANHRSSNGWLGHQNNGHCCIGGIDRESHSLQWLVRTLKQSRQWRLTGNHKTSNGWSGD